MENKRPTQCVRLLNYLEEHKSITQLEALRELGIMRLASRMSELKKEGVSFTKEMISIKNRYGEKVSFARYNLTND